MTQGGRGKKRCHFPPEGDTIGNAITRKCKLGMLTYIAMGISLCPSEWYQSAKFRVLAHALYSTSFLSTYLYKWVTGIRGLLVTVRAA